MIKIDIFSGFLGAGKTTLIKKLIKEAYSGEKLVLIENEFGEIGIDGGFLKDAGIEITEMNSGCICCSLVGDFGKALQEVIERFSPDRILIEPSGVGKLSDVIRAVQSIDSDKIMLNGFTTVVDANKAKIYMKNFGEFFNNQIENASSIILSHTDKISDDKLKNSVALLREHNEHATIISTPWSELDGKVILEAMEQKNTLEAELKKLEHEHHHDNDCDCHEHHHHHHDGDCDCHEHEHHHHGGDCDCHEHEHHHHGGDCDCHEHEHHHHDGECDCHEHHHHHHADEVFTSWGKETTRKFTVDEIKMALDSFTEDTKFGTVLRAKGIVSGQGGEWIHFDYIPGESDIRTGSADIIGRLCVIGAELNTEALEELFGI
jgi:G3E family GTPase